MDNVVQNVKIEDIIPSNFKPSIEEKRNIDKLALTIKHFGLSEPIIVKPKEGKYEIILGMDKYQASLIANQDMVPVIIQEDDINLNIDNSISTSFNNNLPKETFSSMENNSDIINQTELSKIKLEYERHDVKTNNEQFTNNMMNNNLDLPNMETNLQTPAFGGRFFPSLDDEPTNMNMMGGLNPVQNQLPAQNVENNLNNNLIDLTDFSKEQDNVSTPSLEPIMPQNPVTHEPVLNNNFNNQPTNFAMPTPDVTPMPQNSTIINLESLQYNNPSVTPVSEPVSMEILNEDFGAPQMTPPPANMWSTNFNVTQAPTFNEIPNPVQPDLSFNPVTPMPTPVSPVEPLPTFNPNFNEVQPVSTTTPSPLKDVTKVTNTIKNLIANLEEFGYKINVTEEDLPHLTKLTIEVEK